MKHLGMFVFALLTLCAPLAQAHEKREVGDVKLVVGFVNEPAFSGHMNGVDLRVATKKGKPVEGLEEALKVEVHYGTRHEVLELPFRPRWKQPGAYAAYFLPAKSGDYRFRIYGKIGGQDVDEIFESGHGFHGVENSTALTFPSIQFEHS